MIYVFEKEGWIVTQRDAAPRGVPWVELERMIPMPVRDGFTARLRADFAAGKVWYDLVETVDGVRARIIRDIEAHDRSDSVNGFTVGGLSMWLDRETRVGLSRAIDTDKALGRETTVIWHEGPPPIKFELPIEAAEGMLQQLEAYAKATYNITQSHKAAVYELETAAGIEAYDYTAGYPDKPEFNL